MNGSPQDLEDDFVLLDTKDIPLRSRTQPSAPEETVLSLDLQNISTNGKEVLVSIRPPVKPQAGLQHTPCDIVLVIDVSASMNTAAELPDAGRSDAKESSGWSILDLVKHACRTIMEHLNEQDRLAVVIFSTDAQVVQGLLPMTEVQKRETSSRIDALWVHDSTNLWAGIREGLEIFNNTDSIGNSQGMYVLTDGVPNHLNPAQGFCRKLAPMLKELESNKGQAPIVSTFGFGYYLRSSLLRSIAEVGRGSYSFIPDAGMIGTVFVHAVANLFSTYATNVELTLDCSSWAATIEAPSYLAFNTNTQLNTTTIHLGNVQYGQSRDIIVKITKAKPNASLEATLDYQVPRGTRETVTTRNNLDRPHTIPQTVMAYHISRHDLCAFLTSLSTKSHQNEHVALPAGTVTKRQAELTELISTIESRIPVSSANATNLKDLTALLEDLKLSNNDTQTIHGNGQISLALQTTMPKLDLDVHNPTRNPTSSPGNSSLPTYQRSPMCTTSGSSRQPFYTRWGQHYLPSILHAHAYQLAMTFKDPGPLRYGVNSPLFIKCRDDLDNAFDRLPTPKPSLMRGTVGRGGAGAGAGAGVGGPGGTVRPVQISRYNRVDNPCFSGECLVRYADGTYEYRVNEIRAGDILWTTAGGRMVTGVVVTRVESQEMVGVESAHATGNASLEGVEGGKLWVTPWHPVFVGGRWVFPAELEGTERNTISGGEVYSFIMEKDDDERAHTVEIGGIICVTLGHGLTGIGTDDVRTHPFFGDYDVVERNLERLKKDGCGRRISGGIVKGKMDDETVLACGFVGPDETERITSKTDNGGGKGRL